MVDIDRLARPVVAVLERIDRPTSSVLTVFTYHRIVDPASARGLPGLISASPQAFAAQMHLLARTGRVVSMDRVLEARRGLRRLPRGAVAITVDDAYRDFATEAWPILRSLDLPVTLFVPTAYVAADINAFWWDRVHNAFMMTDRSAVRLHSGSVDLSGPSARLAAVLDLVRWLKARPHTVVLQAVAELERRLDSATAPRQTLSWSELGQLAAEGVMLAPHSRTHPRFDRISAPELAEEIRGSRDDLREKTGVDTPVFCYPDGALTPEARGEVARAGFEVAFTTDRGNNDVRRSDWLALRRFNVGRRSGPAIMRAELLPATGRLFGLASAARALVRRERPSTMNWESLLRDG